MRPLFGVALLFALSAGCDGVGRPLVGPVEDGDAGEPLSCEVGPSCRASRTLGATHFDVPTQAAPPPSLDCDGDLIVDTVDNCVGVPNPTQGPSDCEQAAGDCRRLAAGDLRLEGADLRGCRLEAPVQVNGPMSLRGANLACADLELQGTLDTSVDLSGATVSASRVTVRGETPIALDLGRTTISGSSITIRGAARLHAVAAIIEDSAVFVHPSGGAVDGLPAPAVDLSASNIAQSTFFESTASRAGQIRIDRSTIASGRFDVRELDLYGTTIMASQIAADVLDAFEVELRFSEVRTARGAFASSDLSEVIFDRCESLRISDSEASGVDVPACPPLGLRVFRSELDGCNLAGGIELEQSRFFAGVLGGGAATTLTTRDSELDGVRFCELGAAAFIGGDIRCVHCADDAFMSGSAVCVSGATLFERGCPAIELAPTCG